jgi:putative transposase
LSFITSGLPIEDKRRFFCRHYWLACYGSSQAALTIVDHEKYLWAVARYVEQNPVRAGMVEKAEDYPYSSARAHVNGSKDAVLGEELFSNDRRADYTLLLRSDMPRKEIERLRYVTKTGRPFGNEGFVVEMERKLERRLSQRQRGRPRKKP